jgi:hypothetical protein
MLDAMGISEPEQRLQAELPERLIKLGVAPSSTAPNARYVEKKSVHGVPYWQLER